MIKTLTRQFLIGTCLFSLAFTASFGQTTFQTTNLPVVGDNWVGKTFYDTSAQAGPGGMGVIWDFSLYVVSVNTLTQSFRAPASSGTDATFIGANLKCDSYFGWTDYYAKNGTATELQYLGFQNASNEVRITNTQKLITVPFAYGASVSNAPLAGTGYGGSTLTGTISVVADGYGTLKVGGITYTEILRVKYDLDMVEDFGSGLTSPVHVVKYAWYKNGLRAPLMQMSSLNMSGIVGNSVQKYITVAYGTVGIDDINKPSINFNVYPNPSNGQTSVQLNIDRSSDVMLKVIDITGRVVLTQSSYLTSGEHNIKLNLSSLSKGIYILSAIAGTSTREKRIVIAD
ncbi:MAG TPA: T9SS type A sorting domain-containing protein [Bacteroidia bacterium]|nr:T9SS type A sorting domain-containing protein [Bacteroidota bacterium]MBK8584654.1 T9SS type A sorting domain-containing protein [Bacteroidota bacterium]HQW22788.1 T9SS type A sorting domain-containing protein [Bacteroidia bacterium]